MTAAELVVKISADIRGLEAGLLKAAAEIKAFKQEAEGGAGATRDLGRAADDAGSAIDGEGRKASGAEKKTNALSTAARFLARNWQLVVPAAAGAALGVLALTGNIGVLAGVVPVATAVLGVFLIPLTSLAAIVIGFLAPLSTLLALLGLLAGAFFLSGQKALSAASPFSYLKSQVSILRGEFAHLLRTLAGDFMPVFLDVVRVAQQMLTYFNQLAHMPLAEAFRNLATTGVSKMKELVRGIGEVLARPFRMAVAFAFNNNDTEHAMAGLAQRFSNYLFGYDRTVPSGVKGPRAAGTMMQHVPGALSPIVSWFNKQDFTATGRRWGQELAKGIIWSLGSVIKKAMESSTAVGGATGGLLGTILGGLAGASFGAPMIGAAIGGGIGAGIGTAIGHYLPRIREAIIHALGKQTWGDIVRAAQVAWELIKAQAKLAWMFIALTIRAVDNAVRVTIDLVRDLGTKTGIWQVAVMLVRGAVNLVKTLVATLPGMWDNVKQSVSQVWSMVQRVWNAIKNAASSVSGALHSAFGTVHSIVSSIVNAVQTLVYWVEQVASAASRIHFPSIPHGSFTVPGTGIHVPYASGGVVRGGTPGRDSVPAMLTPGEMVLTQRQQRALLEGGGGGGGGGHTFIFQGPIIGSNPQLMARELARILQPYLGSTPSIRIAGA